jgi:DeoR/GlpR family transcriptional regulator of sugar metabolism
VAGTRIATVTTVPRSSALIPEQRRQEILRLLRAERVLSYHQITELLGISGMTARRDVAALAEQGRVQATSGGAAMPEPLAAEPLRAQKAETHVPAKNAIAALAAGMVSDGMTVYLDAGTTVQSMREHLADREGLTVVSNDLATVQAFADHPGVDLICVGGRVEKDNRSTMGRLAALVLAELSLDVAFLSTSSWDLRHGLTTPVEAKIEPKRAALRAATTSVLMADSAKYGTFAKYRVMTLDELDTVVTDEGLDRTARERIENSGVEVLAAAVPG